MENAVAVRHEPFNEKSVLEYLALTGNKQKLLPDESAHFLNIAREFGLNPFKREIYITAFGEGQYRQCSIIVGYEVYLKRAERSGKLSGWKAWTEGSGKDLKAVIEIHRKDWEMPFVHEVFYEEACQRKKDGMPNQFWAKQPRFMTKKVAIAQGMRLCFSDELGGIPYTSDEVSEMHNVTPPVPAAGELASAALPVRPKSDPERERLLALIGEVAETKYLGVAVFPEEDKEEFRNLIREGKTPLPDLLATIEILARDRIATMQLELDLFGNPVPAGEEVPRRPKWNRQGAGVTRAVLREIMRTGNRFASGMKRDEAFRQAWVLVLTTLRLQKRFNF